MGHILHGSAKTTPAVRAAIQRSTATITVLAEKYDLNPKTITTAARRGRETSPSWIGLTSFSAWEAPR